MIHYIVIAKDKSMEVEDYQLICRKGVEIGIKEGKVAAKKDYTENNEREYSTCT